MITLLLNPANISKNYTNNRETNFLTCMFVGRSLGGELPGDGAVQDDQHNQWQPEEETE